jgi:hypothetical protein
VATEIVESGNAAMVGTVQEKVPAELESRARMEIGLPVFHLFENQIFEMNGE